MDDEINKFVLSGLKEQALDVSIDIAEVGLDSIIENEFLQELPLIKQTRLILKSLTSYRDRLLIKNFYSFLSEYHSGSIDVTKKATFLLRLNTESDFSKKFSDFIFRLMDDLDSQEKTEICARLLTAHLNDDFKWSHLVVLCSCVKRMSILTTMYLMKYSKMEWADHTSSSESFSIEERSDMINCGVALAHGSHLVINKYGQDIYKYGLENRNFNYTNL